MRNKRNKGEASVEAAALAQTNTVSAEMLRRELDSDALRQMAVDQPATAELSRALIRKFAHAVESMATSPKEVVAAIGKLQREFSEISSWISDQPIPPAIEEIRKLGTEWIRKGVATSDDVADAERYANRARKGRPTSNRRIAREALDARWRDGLSWQQLAARFCDCGKDHTMQCADRLRHQVKTLEAFLRHESSGEKS